jgi:capsular exopolysaccharide synthesis family protein
VSPVVASVAQKALGVKTSVKDLIKNTNVTILLDTEILDIAYNDTDPKAAASHANAFANAYVSYRTSHALAAFKTAIGGLTKQIELDNKTIDSLTRKIDSLTGRSNSDQSGIGPLESQRSNLLVQVGILQQRLLDLQSGAASASNAAQLVQSADVPTVPVSPRKTRSTLAGLLIGLLLGMGIAYVREKFDDRMQTQQELETRLGVPVLAAIPRVPAWRRAEESYLVLREEPKSPIGEGYRKLVTNVLYAASRERLQVLIVTSALGGEGKSATSSNLALALAEAGKRVILISGDLRRPRIHKFFKLSGKLGMSDALADGMSLLEVAQDPGIGKLRIISGGTIPKNPTELLRSRAAEQFISLAREVADFVVVDTPPVLPVADASILAAMSDGVLYVMDAGSSSRSALNSAKYQLENAGARLIGAVYNGYDPDKTPHYYYGYYGQYEYYDHVPPAQSNGLNGSRTKPRHAKRRGMARTEKGASTESGPAIPSPVDSGESSAEISVADSGESSVEDSETTV